jgi:hypothetical protein
MPGRGRAALSQEAMRWKMSCISLLSLAVGQAHLFDVGTGNLLWTFDDPTPTTRDSFGRSVALAGNNVLVGAMQDDTNGADGHPAPQQFDGLYPYKTCASGLMCILQFSGKR